MTADSEKDIRFLKAIGHVCAETLRKTMGQVRTSWSLRTSDRAITAQFEHTIIVTKNEPIILTL